MAWVLAIPLLPLAAFVVLLPLPQRIRNQWKWVSVAAIFGSLTLAIVGFASLWPGGSEEPVWSLALEIGTIGGEPLVIGVALNGLVALMFVVVTIVGACVQIYSLGYMHRDSREGWFFTVLSLFTSAMLTLVLADNLLLLFLAWELMGLCSYLLIGFWYEMETPRRASMKAFLTTRVGDLGLMLALLVIFKETGSFQYADVLGTAEAWAPGVATAAAFGILVGAMGKSAQVPLHVWLPDAMAGPTPASALIHAATMVAAGVYLVARTLPIFEVATAALSVTLIVGVTTALLGGLMACVQHDVKKVLAYSTISQLGFMFIALGAGSAEAGLFHLVTHAFFKSLLFLGAGVIIHAAHTQDMREMGGLARHLRWTTATFTVGSLALAGVVPFSGFFSKDEILTVLLHEGHYVYLVLTLTASFITAFYVARMWFRVFTGPEQTEGLHEGHASMIAPMVVLAGITTVVGFMGPALARFTTGHEGEWPQLDIALLSTVVALSGIGLGWWVYGRRTAVVNTRALKEQIGYGYDIVAQKFYFDQIYEAILVRPYQASAFGLALFDRRRVDGLVDGLGRAWVISSGASWRFDSRVIDGVVNGAASVSRRWGIALRGLQNGLLQRYQRYVLAGVVFLLVYVVLRGV